MLEFIVLCLDLCSHHSEYTRYNVISVHRCVKCIICYVFLLSSVTFGDTAAAGEVLESNTPSRSSLSAGGGGGLLLPPPSNTSKSDIMVALLYCRKK